MKVTRLPRDPGPSGWARLLPDPPPARSLEGAQTADWLVIGAGFAGLAAAHRLSQLDPLGRIVVLEARRVGEGPAGRNSGFMIDLPHDLTSEDYGGQVERDRAQTKANRRAIDFAADMAYAFGLDTEAFSRRGKINGAATERGLAHNQTYARHLDSMGEPHRLLDADEMRSITGSTYYRGGLFTPGTAIIQPAKFVRGVARGLGSKRVAIFENCPVVSLTRSGSWVAETPAGRVTAPKVILAVNGHLASFGHFRRRLVHIVLYASMTRALTADETARLGGEPEWGLTPADPFGSTVRRISGSGGDRIVVRNRATYEPSLEISDNRLARMVRGHDACFAARFPQLAGAPMEHRWGGRLCLSLNDVQVVREAEPGLFTACCQNGLGTAKGTAAGMLAAELAAGVAPDPAYAPLLGAPDPTPVPPAPFDRIGAAARIRWGELRAGREM